MRRRLLRVDADIFENGKKFCVFKFYPGDRCGRGLRIGNRCLVRMRRRLLRVDADIFENGKKVCVFKFIRIRVDGALEDRDV